MKEHQIEILFKGIKRDVSEDQYSKLKLFPYHKMLSPRLGTSRNTMQSPNSTSRLREYEQDTQKNLNDLKVLVDNILTDIMILQNKNSELTKEIKKNNKIERVLPKKNIKPGKGNFLQEQQFQKYQEFILALKVIELQEALEQKVTLCKSLSTTIQKQLPTKHNDLYNKKLEKLNKLFFSGNKQQNVVQLICQFKNIEKNLSTKANATKQLSKKCANRLKVARKEKKVQEDNLSEINYFVSESSVETANIQLKRIRKDPSEFIETSGGQMKNVGQLQFEIEQLRKKNQEIENNMRSYMQQKILKKINLRNQIETMEDPKCNKQSWLKQKEEDFFRFM